MVAPLPEIIPRAQHCISRSDISINALKVLNRLADGGFESFLVGGAVRDLLLGQAPKDFDIATSAKPEEVRSLFRNCRLIGRRFRLAHIHFARDIIEVATFRGTTDEDSDKEVSEQGRILRDNTYGSIDSDVWRRDFSINALYYNIKDQSVWDYVGGVRDIEERRLRLVGDPTTRYVEDPVRMLRAARFQAKLGFDLDPETGKAIDACSGMLRDVPPARKYEEVLKLFLSGHAAASFDSLDKLNLLDQVLPAAAQALARNDSATQSFYRQAMENTDQRVRDGKSITPFFLFGTMLWPELELQAQQLQAKKGLRQSHALQVAASHLIAAQQQVTALPRRVTAPMREMLGLQARLLLPQGRRTWALLRHPRFRAAYDLLLLRSGAGLAEASIAEWWTQIQQADADTQGEMIRQAERQRPKKKGRRRRRRRGRGGKSVPADN